MRAKDRPQYRNDQMTRIIDQHIHSERDRDPVYSHAPEPAAGKTLIDYRSKSEFSALINGRPAADVWPIIDELVTAVQVLNPKLYDHFIQDLQ